MLHVAVVDIRARERITGIFLSGCWKRAKRIRLRPPPEQTLHMGKQKIAAAVLYLDTLHPTATHL